MFNYSRRKSSEVHIGNTPLGGDNPIRIQSMANVSTMDTEAAVAQAERMIDAGAEYVRFTAQGEREARNLGEIRRLLNEKGLHTPLVADIHFNPRAADVAAENVEKVRINPGNYVDRVKTFNLMEYTDEEYAAELQKIRERLVPFLDICRKNGTAIRLGVNHGSLSDRIMSRYGDTPEGMVASCMEFLRICREENFNDVVISIKASNTVVMVRTVRLLVCTMDKEGMSYPLHLGVTEAGDGEDGRIKSAVGIGALLADGIGDTIRVSLSEAPEAEMPVARKLRDYILEREGHEHIEAVMAPGYDEICPAKRVSDEVLCVGGRNKSAVIVDVRNKTAEDLSIGGGEKPDFLYVESVEKAAEWSAYAKSGIIVDSDIWNGETEKIYPCFSADKVEELKNNASPLKFVALSYNDIKSGWISVLKEEKNIVVILTTSHKNGVGEQRAALHYMMSEGVNAPVIIHREYSDSEVEMLQLKSSADLGALLLGGFTDGIMLSAPAVKPSVVVSCMFGILQAARVRISRTEYISCPSCGRTLYDLQATIAKIKAATSHLVGLKIGIMGCIVNGPGEMADADYGYVGAGRNRISLYKGKTCVLKNIPEEEAVERLLELIEKDRR